jgi:SAM-dependent methyltransferase
VSAESRDPLRERAGAFGSVAKDYDRFRPGPVAAVVDWLLPDGAGRVVDLGAGTGALTRLLVGRVAEVIAIEPDARMREVLMANVAGVSVLDGRGDAMPLADSGADAVLVSSAWHWMDNDGTVSEVARVLRRGGILGVVWSGVDWMGSWFAEMRQRALAAGGGAVRLASMVAGEGSRPERALRLPETAFGPPEHELIHWQQDVSADQLVGMLGTFSRVILLPQDQRHLIAEEARRLLREDAGLEGSATATLPFRADCWRAVRLADQRHPPD